MKTSPWNCYIPFFDGNDDDAAIDIEESSSAPFSPPSSSVEKKTTDFRRQWKAFWKMSLPYFYESSEGKCLFVGLIILMLLDSSARVFFSFLARDFWSALGDKDADRFYYVMKCFLISLLLLAPINVFYRFQRQRLAIKWRKWMTERILNLYFYNPHQIYYRLERNGGTKTAAAGEMPTPNSSSSFNTVNNYYVDNPDQRLAEDVRSFTQYSLSLFLMVAISVIDLAAFSVVLFTIEPMLFLSILGFATFGTIMTVLLGKDLVWLNFKRLQKEADFRFSLIRIRENAESIAFFRGERMEGYEVKRRFTNVVNNCYDVIGTQRNLEFFTTSYNYLTWILPVVVIAPQYMAGNVELGVVQQAAAAFGHILDDLSLIINSFEDLSEFSASVERLHQFVHAVQYTDPDRDEYSPLMGYCIPPDHKDNYDTDTGTYTAPSIKDGVFKKSAAENDAEISLQQLPPLFDDDPGSKNIQSTALSIRNLCLCTPNRNRILLHSLDLELKWGEKLLIIGKSGIGKSSLLRAIAGLWTTGSGIIKRPNISDVYFLPQKPYCPIGSLRDQLLYPFCANTTMTARNDDKSVPKKTKEQNDRLPVVVSDEKLLQILIKVDLYNLATRSGDGDPIRGLDAIVDWSNVLSLGEQQRLAFGRVLVNRPSLVIADEATSAMDVSAEEIMYKLISNLTYVSVGHRPTLLKYHDKRLQLHKLNNNDDKDGSRCNFTFDDICSTTAKGITGDEVNLFFQ